MRSIEMIIVEVEKIIVYFEGENIVELEDPMCDPLKPRKIQFSDISAAAFNIRKAVLMTPCTVRYLILSISRLFKRSHQLSKLLKTEIYFKKEFLQVTGSFKERGARNALIKLTKEEKINGVIAASAGNHALALCYHGEILNIPVTVVMPVTAPLMKITLCRSFGANIVLDGENLSKAKATAMKLAKENNLKYINGYDHPDIIAGQGTIGLEVLEQVENVDAIIVPTGGGGLISGIALAVKTLNPHITVVGVEAETCPSFKRSLEAGTIIETKAASTLADGLAVPLIGGNAMATAQGFIDQMVTVTEKNTALAILRLLEMEKAVVEGAGAVGLAAFIEHKLPQLVGKRVVIILSGGNIDTTVLGRTIERGLAADSRLVHFDVLISDRPGGIAELATLLSHQGVSIKDIFHERAWISKDVFSVRIRAIVETRDNDHAHLLESALKERYKDVNFSDFIEI
ncbi:unnamed protein product [Dracunculus medinensis]|uniref:L-serine deaminase n=1 Tax=Dracunculus medinensis TaxID=318479 RepID=A0A0N4UKG8_DRAME|nr:unnamed protein product [Dracunculus medinensis]